MVPSTAMKSCTALPVLLLLLAASSSTSGAVSPELAGLVGPLVQGSLLDRLSGALQAVNATCECSHRVRDAVRAARDGHLWALKLVDASARVPSGLLSGNVNQLGDYDECLSQDLEFSTELADCPAAPGAGSTSPTYCLASVALQVPEEVGDDRLKEVSRLLYSNTPFKSNFSDPGHRVPRFSAAHVAVCIPSACSPAELQAALEWLLNAGAASGRVSFRASVAPGLCRSRDREEPADGLGASLARKVFWLAVWMVALGTFLDLVCLEGEGPALLMSLAHCVSARRNWRRLCSTERPRGDVACLHGVRGANALGLLVAHKSVALLYLPYVNRTPAVAVLGMSWSIIGRVAILYTDCFILLSGVLASLALLRRLDRTGSVNWARRLVDRYVRLTPTLAGLIVFCTLILPALGRGPMWGLVIDPHAALCRQHWWRNILYIHNYYGFETMCLTHTHQLGIDMQLFAVAPLLVYPLWRWPRAGAALLLLLAALSTALRYHVVLINELSTIVYFGNPVTQMFKTASMSYILPTHRLTVYVMGILLGYALHRIPESFRFPKGAATLGWLVFVPIGLLPVLGPHDNATPDFRYDVRSAAMYAAFAPIMWNGFVCWGILACARQAGGSLGNFISWKGWLVMTRVAYALYLTQFPIFFYNVGSARNAEFYTICSLLNIGEFAVIFVASAILCLTFEMPFQELWKLWTEERKDAGGEVATQQDSKKVYNKIESSAKRKAA